MVKKKPVGSELGDATLFPLPTKFGRVYRENPWGSYIGGGNLTTVSQTASGRSPIC